MTLLHALILGLVEGITEFLPVSSTGHMILVSYFLHIPQDEFLKTFEIFIQLGALLALVFVFAKKLWNKPSQLKNIGIAFVPTVIGGLIFYKIVKHLLSNPLIVVWSLFVGGAVLVLVEKYMKERSTRSLIAPAHELSKKQALIVGCSQVVAFIPGVSRSGATIVGGLLSGVSRSSIVEFSFLLSLPTIAAASGLDLIKTTADFNMHNTLLLAIGFCAAFVSALFCIRFFIRYISNHSFVSFGIYRMILALVVVFFL